MRPTLHQNSKRKVKTKFQKYSLSDDDFEIKSKIYSFNLRLVLKHILHCQDGITRFAFHFSFLNCRLWFLELQTVTEYSPQGNGQVERFNEMIK